MNYYSYTKEGIENARAVANKKQKLNFLIVLLVIYIFFLYNAQDTLLPRVLNSISLYIFLLCTVLFVFVTGQWSNTLPQYSKWYTCMIVLSVCSVAWATETAWETIYTMIVSLIVTYCFIVVLDTPYKLELCIRSFVFSADVMGLLMLIKGQLFENIGEDRLGHSQTGNANAFAALMMVAAVFAFWLVLYKAKSVLDKAFNIASFTFILLMMALSGGRKAIVAVVVCVLFFIVFKNRMSFFNFLKNFVIAIIVIGILYYLIMNNPSLYDAIGWRFEELFKMFGGGTSGVNSDSLRADMVKMALDKWQECPLWGHGHDTFKYYNQIVTGHLFYAHNNYAELLYDLGLVGFALYYGYICKLGHSLFKLNDENREYKVLGIALLIELLIFDIGGVSYYTVMTQIVLCITFLCWKLGKKV